MFKYTVFVLLDGLHWSSVCVVKAKSHHGAIMQVLRTFHGDPMVTGIKAERQ